MNIKKDISKILKNRIKTFTKRNNNGDESDSAGALSGEINGENA
jgi:hypothetical protein